MVPSVLSIENIMIRGAISCKVASSFLVSLQLTNDHMVPLSNIVYTENSWVQIGKYKHKQCYALL